MLTLILVAIFAIGYGFFKALGDLKLFWTDNKVKDWCDRHYLGEWYVGGNKTYPPGRAWDLRWILAAIKKYPSYALHSADYWHTVDEFRFYCADAMVSLLLSLMIGWWAIAVFLVAAYLEGNSFTLFSHYLFRKDPDGPVSEWFSDFVKFWNWSKRAKYLKTF